MRQWPPEEPAEHMLPIHRQKTFKSLAYIRWPSERVRHLRQRATPHPLLRRALRNSIRHGKYGFHPATQGRGFHCPPWSMLGRQRYQQKMRGSRDSGPKRRRPFIFSSFAENFRVHLIPPGIRPTRPPISSKNHVARTSSLRPPVQRPTRRRGAAPISFHG